MVHFDTTDERNSELALTLFREAAEETLVGMAKMGLMTIDSTPEIAIMLSTFAPLIQDLYEGVGGTLTPTEIAEKAGEVVRDPEAATGD